jgi:hypothetical protein
MLQDLRFALRMIASHPWFAAAVVVTLALGIGVNTTVFTLVNAVLFKPVPVPGGDRLVAITGQDLKPRWRPAGGHHRPGSQEAGSILRRVAGRILRI